jgi:hypothetical protein
MFISQFVNKQTNFLVITLMDSIGKFFLIVFNDAGSMLAGTIDSIEISAVT